jgi:hypothetical protein
MPMTILNYFKRWREKQRRGGDRHQLIVLLDDDSLERFERLKFKIRTLDSSALVTSALKCFENRTDRIIKRRIVRTIRALKKEGLDSDQIANYLNNRSIAGFGETTRWQSHDISRLMEEEGSDSLRRPKNVSIRNH